MKKWSVVAAILMFIAILLLGGIWFLYTPTGARVLVRSLSRMVPAKVSLGAIEGDLTHDLTIRDVKVSIPRSLVSISVRSVVISARYPRFLGGTILIDRLRLEDVTVADSRPKTAEPFRFAWPRLAGFGSNLQGSITELVIEKGRYARLGETVLPFEHIKAHVSWRGGILSLRDLTAEAPVFSGRGSIEAGFSRPLLKADVVVDFRRPIAGITRLSGKTELRRGRSPEQLAGAVFAQALFPKKVGASVDGRFETAADEIRLRGFQLACSAISGSMAGESSLIFHGNEPLMGVTGRVKDVRAGKGAMWGAVALAGEIRVQGMPKAYTGAFSLTGGNPGLKARPWQSGQATGTLKGDLTGLSVVLSDGRWLGGTVRGGLRASWDEGLAIEAALHGRGMDPARLDRSWAGVINTDADLRITETPASGMEGAVNAAFPESTLRGQALKGELTAHFDNRSYRLDQLNLQGKGFNVKGSGTLEEKLLFDLAIADMSGLIPATSGSIFANGWLRWKSGELSGTAAGRGSNLRFEGVAVDRTLYSGELVAGGPQRLKVNVRAEGIARGTLKAQELSLSVDGTRENHRANGSIRIAGSDVHLTLEGGQNDDNWSGMITRLYGTDAFGKWALASPSRLSFSPGYLRTGALQFAGSHGESLTAEADILFDPVRGNLNATWEAVNLARADAFFSTRSAPRPRSAREKEPSPSLAGLTGTASGSVSVRWPEEKAGRSIQGRIAVSARYRDRSMELPLDATIRADWKRSGLAGAWEIALQKGEKASGIVSAAGPPEIKLPEKASISAEWQGIEIVHLARWLPPSLTVTGRLSGTAAGTLTPGGAVDFTGGTVVSQGSAEWRSAGGTMTAAIQNGSARFAWAGASLRGELSLALASYGSMTGQFLLPLPARLPAAFNPDGPFSLSLKGHMGEQGLLAALLPSALQETKGAIDVDIGAEGTWSRPKFAGGATLKDASAYVPAAGVRIGPVKGEVSITDDRVHLQMRVESGGGWIETLADGRIGKGEAFQYRGTLKGDAFQILNRPDVRASVNPNITFQGDQGHLAARGDITVPRMSIYGRQSDAVIRPSSDIVIADAPDIKGRTSPVDLDVQVRVVLGDKVRVESQGFDARLEGNLNVEAKGVDRISARGRIRIAEGGYKAYGVRLTVTRGNINFVGPIDRPTLDILATKKSQDVTAGVQVTGNARAPTVTLYSSPPLSDSDKLAYIILGHRLATADAYEASTIAGVTGMFEGGATPTMTSEARKRLGLGGPPGTTAQEAAAQSMVSVGRYLTPAFYVGIGRSLLTNENLLTLRYNLSKSWEVESRVGGETGADIFYRIEFD